MKTPALVVARPGRRPRWPRPPPPGAALNVVTTTEDLASLAREVGGDKVKVESLARGYQDPHFVEAKPSFVLKLQQGRPADRGRAASWRSAGCRRSSPRAATRRSSPGGAGYLDASLTREDPGDPHRPDHARHGRRPPAGQPALLARSRQRPAHRQGHPEEARRRWTPADAAYFAQRDADFEQRLAAAEKRWDAQMAPYKGVEDRHLPPLLAQLRRPLRPRRDRLRRAAARHPALAAPHPRPHQGDEATRA